MTIKNLLPLLIIIFSISIYTSCQNDSASTKKTKTEQRKKLNKAKKANKKNANKKKNAKPKPLPPISKLKKSDKQTRATIHEVNGNKAAKDKQPFRLTDKNILVKGIAIDRPRKNPAAGVYVKIGEQYFKANYGKPSKILAEQTKNPRYSKAGFSVNIPKTKIKNGDYEVSLCVVSSDRKTYYEQKEKVKIKVR